MVNLIEKDRYGRIVAELFVKPQLEIPGYQPEEEIFLNGKIVRAGFARHYPKYSGNCPNKKSIEQAEEIAIANRAGMWSYPNAVAPWEYRKLKRQDKNKLIALTEPGNRSTTESTRLTGSVDFRMPSPIAALARVKKKATVLKVKSPCHVIWEPVRNKLECQDD